jgi:GWxTD domain-containing protein
VVASKISDPSDGKIVYDKKWTTSALLPRDSSSPNNTVVYDQWAELLNPGSYNVTISVSAEQDQQSGEAEFKIEVPEFDSSTFSISQIEFVSEVKKASNGSPFANGNKEVIPNPWRRYGALNSRLSFFYEIYNLPSGGNLKGEYTITNNAGETVKQLSDIKYGNSSENLSVVLGINISRLPTGTYDLNIIIDDSGDGNSYSQSRTFEVIQLDSITQNAGLTEEEAEIEGGLIKYIGTPSEYNFYENLDLAGKTRYVINFWAEKDPTPGTRENEYLQKIMERFRYADKNFKWGKVPGWKSDRGRVIIKYGMPDDIDYHNTEADMKNYEVWTYNQDKKFIFVFADLRSNGNYRLIHSTKEGEVSDPNWRDYLNQF